MDCRCHLQNAVPDVGDLMNLETSFTNSVASIAENSSLGHPTTTLTIESECGTAVNTGRHRQSVDSFGAGLSVMGKSGEFPLGKPVEIPPLRRASSPAGPTAQHRLVLLQLLLPFNDRFSASSP